ncbi:MULTISPECIES: rubredoxin [unclassified Prochlorococcus]|uniref:rubredoxin n=1 Tax=unclassified Prochlorococcus TaxID=2627481 RepID=UPI0005338F0F|nr:MULTISPECIES: rubredoxin [unclassified Prochlorococcus]KGG16580.1 Rubredoxin [Prochlorococcus sp. MIT 0602]KGG16945.1 Rubredoxin [Prochlorococcus sp. MIT 0603]
MNIGLDKSNYQCRDCIYTYKPDRGDPSQAIPAGTPFEKLPDSWVCPICKARKFRFKAKDC